jgi:hypothetical protein
MVFRWVLEVSANLFHFAPLHSYRVETALSFESEYMQIHLSSAEKSTVSSHGSTAITGSLEV